MLTTDDLKQIEGVVEKVVERVVERTVERTVEKVVERKLKPIRIAMKRMEKRLLKSINRVTDYSYDKLYNHENRLHRIENNLNLHPISDTY
jgi:hypothetical protein